MLSTKVSQQKNQLQLLQKALKDSEPALISQNRSNSKRKPHEMVDHTETICWQFADELLSVFDHFVILVLKWLIKNQW